MSNKVLVDTSVWIEFFRTRSKIGDSLAALLTKNNVSICGVILFELLQGIKAESEKARILGILSGLPYFEMSPDLWQKAAEISQSLKKSGINIPLSDVFIAAIAISNKLSIFTVDRHFEQIPDISIYKP